MLVDWELNDDGSCACEESVGELRGENDQRRGSSEPTVSVPESTVSVGETG